MQLLERAGRNSDSVAKSAEDILGLKVETSRCSRVFHVLVWDLVELNELD